VGRRPHEGRCPITGGGRRPLGGGPPPPARPPTAMLCHPSGINTGSACPNETHKKYRENTHHPSSLIPHPSSLIPHPSSFIPHPSPARPLPSHPCTSHPGGMPEHSRRSEPRADLRFPIPPMPRIPEGCQRRDSHWDRYAVTLPTHASLPRAPSAHPLPSHPCTNHPGGMPEHSRWSEPRADLRFSIPQMPRIPEGCQRRDPHWPPHEDRYAVDPEALGRGRSRHTPHATRHTPHAHRLGRPVPPRRRPRARWDTTACCQGGTGRAIPETGS